MRSAHALVSGSELGLLFPSFSSSSAITAPRGKNIGETGADIIIENEEFEFLAKLAMIALLGFIEHCEVIVEFLLWF